MAQFQDDVNSITQHPNDAEPTFGDVVGKRAAAILRNSAATPDTRQHVTVPTNGDAPHANAGYTEATKARLEAEGAAQRRRAGLK